MQSVKARDAVEDCVAKDNIDAVEDEEVHELGCVTGSEACIIDLLGLIVELDLDLHDLEALDERWWLSWLCRFRRGVVFKLEEASDEVQCILVDMEAQWQDVDFDDQFCGRKVLPGFDI